MGCFIKIDKEVISLVELFMTYLGLSDGTLRGDFFREYAENHIQRLINAKCTHQSLSKRR